MSKFEYERGGLRYHCYCLFKDEGWEGVKGDRVQVIIMTVFRAPYSIKRFYNVDVMLEEDLGSNSCYPLVTIFAKFNLSSSFNLTEFDFKLTVLCDLIHLEQNLYLVMQSLFTNTYVDTDILGDFHDFIISGSDYKLG